MDYEKKYKEAFEIAKEALKTDMHESGANAIRRIFPELQESEDERIRKWLYDYIERVGRTWGKQPFNYEQILVWLEKQKEQKQIKFTDLTWEDIVELEGIINNVHYDFSAGIGQESFGKEVLKRFRSKKGIEYLDEEEQKYWLESQKELKPAEWSDEDEENFKWFDKFFRAESIVVGGKDIPQDKYLWFKSLRPHPKQEWSENDENRFRNLIYLVERSNEGKGTKEGFVKFINRLKSLRPSWKPSEEQMEELDNARHNLTASCDVLTSLHEQLKNLI